VVSIFFGGHLHNKQKKHSMKLDRTDQQNQKPKFVGPNITPAVGGLSTND
jgi:hypothetical protein